MTGPSIINSSQGSKGGFSDAQLPPKEALDAMTAAVDYYVKLRKIIDIKIGHAYAAVEKRLQDLKTDDTAKTSAFKRNVDLGRSLMKLRDILYTAMLTIKEMEDIEEILERMPEDVDVHYRLFVKLDKELDLLIEEIKSAEYQKAYKRAQKIIDTIQDGKNLLSGLTEVEQFGRRARVVEKMPKGKEGKGNNGPAFVITSDGRKVRVF